MSLLFAACAPSDDDLEARVAALEAAEDDGRIGELEDEVAALQDQVDTLQGQVDSLEEEVASLQSDVDAFDTALADAEVDSADAEAAEAEAEAAELEAEAAQDGEIAALDTRMSSLEGSTDLADAVVRIDTLEATCATESWVEGQRYATESWAREPDRRLRRGRLHRRWRSQRSQRLAQPGGGPLPRLHELRRRGVRLRQPRGRPLGRSPGREVQPGSRLLRDDRGRLLPAREWRLLGRARGVRFVGDGGLRGGLRDDVQQRVRRLCERGRRVLQHGCRRLVPRRWRVRTDRGQ